MNTQTSDFEAKWEEILSTLSHLRPPKAFGVKDTLNYARAMEFWSLVAKELDNLALPMMKELIDTGGFVDVPTIGFEQYAAEFYNPEYSAVIQVLNGESKGA